MTQWLRFTQKAAGAADFRAEVLSGLGQAHKRLPSKFFYDREGSALFEAICATPEYYPARAEAAILRDQAAAIAETVGRDCVLIEPGSGASRKVRLLLDGLRPRLYLPLDICGEYLLGAARGLVAERPGLRVHAVCMDYGQGLDLLESCLPPGDHKRVVFFPGSTIGNFEPGEALAFLGQVARLVAPAGGLLIGVDVRKEPEQLHRAYNDAQGLTREFNLNLLRRINHALQADFDPGRFYHYAFYHTRKCRVEMHLVSRGAQRVRVAGESLGFADGESIHTENCYKYTVEEFRALAVMAGFRAMGCWRDEAGLFSVQYFELRGQDAG
ncbi:dimethylhistidine N-methyltransferase [Methylomagnum ishizawai]|uniref:Dimethylhistidine N-methyltransferase n=1 Tax=Methylomagnum ishizawai TaxID=1760988 RepID=A0A1Y6D3M6_9GAMM|nr:L-histidine N(alpha)-methyltransferase [Methylomagnum ishizawai]SMF94994.1 dimethylhistidine N-methyltransferase [Methylomagnum ishizawai]